MTLGDQRTYSTVQRVTPLTDGTLDSIHMANPGTTYEAGVMPGAWSLSADFVDQRPACRPGAHRQIRTWGSVLQVVRGASSVGTLQGSGVPRRRKVAQAVWWNQPSASARSRWYSGASSGHESSDRFISGLTLVLATRLNGGRACRSLRKVAFASKWFSRAILKSTLAAI